MINVSAIKTHMYCPMKLYIQNHVDTNEDNNFQLAVELKKLKIDISDLIQKNMRKIKKDMNLVEIEQILSQTIDSYIESSANAIKSMDLGLETSQINQIIDDTYFNIKIKALKIKRAMTILDKNAFEIMDMFYPNCMYSYLLKEQQLELIGMCDKVEIVDGKYYPVTIKGSSPPIKGVWDQDAIELVAYAILLEEEFETEVFVGFVDYDKIGDRRPVVMDANLRKGLFDIMGEVTDIIDNKKLPNVRKNPRKCGLCEYNEICFKE